MWMVKGTADHQPKSAAQSQSQPATLVREEIENQAWGPPRGKFPPNPPGGKDR